MPLAFGSHEAHPMVDAIVAPGVDRAIDERDDMLSFAMALFGHDRDAALASYFLNGIEQLQLLRHLAAWRGLRPKRFLDFASGYGRLTRFLLHEEFAEELTVSDILEGGMEFQTAQFGVRTILSSTSPQQFQAPERYDVIFVASLFTHLPPPAFTAWLRRLVELLAPEGLLIFSVHDEWIAPHQLERGIGFAAQSESRVLEGAEYGSTWVSEPYVRSQLAAIRSSLACVRLPRALSDWQDVYVVSPAPIPAPSPYRVPIGFLERCQRTADGLRYAGWAAVRDGALDRVEIRVGDRIVATVRELLRRDDVAAEVGAAAASRAGWECLVSWSDIGSLHFQIVTVSAFSEGGAERILYLGAADAAPALDRERERVLRQQRESLRQQSISLAAARAAMEQSSFWRARNAWWRVTGRR